MFDKKMVMIPAGRYLTVSTGEYSDYYVSGVFRSLKDIDAWALREEWLREHPEQLDDYSFDDRAFLGWVTRKGMLEAVPSFEWHLSDYNRASEMDVLDSSENEGESM